MLQKTKPSSTPTPGAGLCTFTNLFSLQPGQTPNAMNVKFGIGGTVEKRLGSTTMNVTALVNTAASGFLLDTNKTLGVSLNAYWRLDEQAGTRIDQFGSNDLNAINNPGFCSGIVGNAVSFAAVNTAYLIRENNSVLQTGAINFSLNGFVQLFSKSATQALIGKRLDTGGSNQFEYSFEYDQTTDNFRFYTMRTDGSIIQQVSGGGPITVGSSYMFTLIQNSQAGLLSIRIGTATANSASFTEVPVATSAPFILGAQTGSSILNPASAFLDQVSYYKKVLSSQEITDLFNSGSGNNYSKGASNAGYGSFDFGSGNGSDGKPIRWLTFSVGTGIVASSNRGVSFVTIATDRGADYQEFERSKNLLYAFSDTYNRVLYWAGSPGTSMIGMPVGSAPPVKHGIDFAGFLLLMNDSAGKRSVTYAPNNTTLTDAWNNTFEVSSSYDDEITGATVLDKSCYAFTKYTVSRISAVGGNPDFAVQKLKNWGAVPRTIKRVTFPSMPWVGEVAICLGYDKKIRIFDGYFDRVISDPIEQDNGMFPAPLAKLQEDSIEKAFAEVDDREQTYRLWVAISPSTEVTHMIGLNLRTMAFYGYDNQGFSTIVAANSGNFRNLFGMTRFGFVHWIDTTNRDAGVPINEYYDFSFLMAPLPKSVVKTQKLDMWLSPTSSGTLYYQERRNFGSAYETPAKDSITLADTTAAVQIRWSVDIPSVQNIYQGRITSSSSTANPWKMNRFDFEVSDLGVGEA